MDGIPGADILYYVILWNCKVWYGECEWMNTPKVYELYEWGSH